MFKKGSGPCEVGESVGLKTPCSAVVFRLMFDIFSIGETQIVKRSYLSLTFKVTAFEGKRFFPFWT